MRVIAKSRLLEYCKKHRQGRQWLLKWHDVTQCADWASIRDVKQTYPSADAVKVATGKSVTVFNVCGNKYRLVVAIRYKQRTVYVLWFGTHAEYDKNKWKAKL